MTTATAAAPERTTAPTSRPGSIALPALSSAVETAASTVALGAGEVDTTTAPATGLADPLGSGVASAPGEGAGEADGDTLGELFGDTFGEADGDTLGEADGDTLGEADGDTLGEADGDTSGVADGVDVGFVDGVVVGVDVGFVDGVAVGVDVGFVDGCAVSSGLVTVAFTEGIPSGDTWVCLPSPEATTIFFSWKLMLSPPSALTVYVYVTVTDDGAFFDAPARENDPAFSVAVV